MAHGVARDVDLGFADALDAGSHGEESLVAVACGKWRGSSLA